MEFTNVLIKPLVTEKSQLLQNSEPKKYAFIVNDKATKDDIKQAFSIIYGIFPKKVATLRRKPVSVRTGTAKPGYSKLQKIAYITLPKGQDIAISAEDGEIKKEIQDDGKKK